MQLLLHWLGLLLYIDTEQSESDVIQSEASEEITSAAAAEDASHLMDAEASGEDASGVGALFRQALDTFVPQDFKQQFSQVA